jgi:NitT/TauT family transport system permease protein
MPRRPGKWLRLSLRGLIVPAILLVVWEAAARLWLARSILIPPPSEVLRTFGGLLADGTLLAHTGSSILRVLTGFAISVLVALPLGLLMGWSRLAHELFDPTVQVFRPIPGTAWVPASILLFGIGDRPALFLIFIGTVWPILLATIHGVRTIDRHLVWAALTMGADRRRLFTKVVFPAALPAIFSGCRVGMGVAWTFVVVAELIAVRTGLGYMIMEARLIVRPDIVFAGMIAIGLVGLALDWAARFAMRRVLRWQRGLVLE